ncbi:hypothetical protein [Geomesophilobacter sediminis]|uniref:Uncharacterized protein n=1 Tax=Geomesophilobacter sediminis TaxID=2798584 RepID=A0A8J7J0H5_9BACT|nr:hypothetical protein [Geomesophilobacter sediminis]MBJ6723883.1 hypothetical protein [Geomesophilobacter sediminis]
MATPVPAAPVQVPEPEPERAALARVPEVAPAAWAVLGPAAPAVAEAPVAAQAVAAVAVNRSIS